MEQLRRWATILGIIGLVVALPMVINELLSDSPILAAVIGIPFWLAVIAFLASPAYALYSAKVFQRISDTPGAWKTARFPFIIFMNRTQNRFSQREKGNRPVDLIGLVQKGEESIKGVVAPGNLTPQNSKFWELQIIDNPAIPSEVGPYHRYWFIRLWVAYINLFVDVALVGIRDIYRMRWYPIEKTRYTKISVKDPTTQETSTRYEVIPPAPPEAPEYSNHVRVTPFDWIVAISGAETSDRFAWNILVAVNVECMNPWVTFNNHESWSRFLTQAVTDAIVRALRKLKLPDVLELGPANNTADPSAPLGDEARDKVIGAVYDIDKRLQDIIGLKLSSSADVKDQQYSGAVQILSAEPMFRTEADRNAFMEIWRAEQKAASERILGDAEAYRESTVVDKVGAATKLHGEAGELVQRMQSMERAAAAGGSIIFDSGDGRSSIEKLLALLVAERESKTTNQPRRNRT